MCPRQSTVTADEALRAIPGQALLTSGLKIRKGELDPHHPHMGLRCHFPTVWF